MALNLSISSLQIKGLIINSPLLVSNRITATKFEFSRFTSPIFFNPKKLQLSRSTFSRATSQVILLRDDQSQGLVYENQSLSERISCNQDIELTTCVFENIHSSSNGGAICIQYQQNQRSTVTMKYISGTDCTSTQNGGFLFLQNYRLVTSKGLDSTCFANCRCSKLGHCFYFDSSDSILKETSIYGAESNEIASYAALYYFDGTMSSSNTNFTKNYSPQFSSIYAFTKESDPNYYFITLSQLYLYNNTGSSVCFFKINIDTSTVIFLGNKDNSVGMLNLETISTISCYFNDCRFFENEGIAYKHTGNGEVTIQLSYMDRVSDPVFPEDAGIRFNATLFIPTYPDQSFRQCILNLPDDFVRSSQASAMIRNLFIIGGVSIAVCICGTLLREYFFRKSQFHYD